MLVSFMITHNWFLLQWIMANIYFQAIFTKDKHAVNVCQMPLEYTIIFIYLTPIIFIIFKILKIKQILYQQTSNIKHTINNQYQYIQCHK